MKPLVAVLMFFSSAVAFAQVPFPPPEKLVRFDVSALIGSPLSTAIYLSTLNAFRAAGLLSTGAIGTSSTIRASSENTDEFAAPFTH